MLSAVRYAKTLNRLNHGLFTEPERWPLAIIVAVLPAVIGVLMTVYLATTAW